MTPKNAPEPQRVTFSVADVVATYRTMRAINHALAERELTAFLVVLLASFAERPGVKIGTVAKTLGFSAAVATGGIDRLEKRGLVQRVGKSISEHSRDRRTVLVEVTERGRELLASLTEIEVEL